MAAASGPSLGDLHVIVLLDTTASMSSAISSMKQTLDATLRDIAQQCTLTASFVDVGDYDRTPATRSSGPTADVEEIRQAVSRCSASGGGDGPEAYRTGLHDALELAEKTNANPDKNSAAPRTVVVLVADFIPHFQRDPQSTYYQNEKAHLQTRDRHFLQWRELCVALADAGLQVFTLVPLNGLRLAPMYLPYAILAEFTGGMVLHVRQNDSSSISACLVALFRALLSGERADSVELPSSLALFTMDPEADPLDEEDDDFIVKRWQSTRHGTVTVSDRATIVERLEASRRYFRLSPSEKGFKRARAHLNSNELVEVAPFVVKALAFLHGHLSGDDVAAASAAAFNLPEGSPDHVVNTCRKLNTVIDDILSRADESHALETDEVVCELADDVSLSSQREGLAELASAAASENFGVPDDANEDAQIEFWVRTLGPLFMGFPFLIELNESGKFNFQDPWAMPVRHVYPQCLAFPTLLSMLDADKNKGGAVARDAKASKQIESCRALFRDGRVSGVVGIAHAKDPISSGVARLLHAGGWGDALAAFMAHGHIEPLPWVWHAALGASMVDFMLAFIRGADRAHTEAQIRTVSGLADTLRVLPLVGGAATKELHAYLGGSDAAQGNRHAADAFAPQEPRNIGAWSRVAVMIAQLPREVLTATSPSRTSSLARAILGEFIAFYVNIHMSALDRMQRARWIADRVLPDVADPSEMPATDAHELDTATGDPSVLLSLHNDLTSKSTIIRDATARWLDVVAPALAVPCREVGDKEVAGAFAEAVLMGSRAARYTDLRFSAVGVAEDAAGGETLLRHVRCSAWREIYAASLVDLRGRRLQTARGLVAAAGAAAFWTGPDALLAVLLETVPIRGVVHKPDADDVAPILQLLLGAERSTSKLDQSTLSQTVMMLCTGRRDVALPDSEWGDSRRFADLELLRQFVNDHLPAEAVTALMTDIESAIARSIPNRHGHHLVRLPAASVFSLQYATRRLANLMCPDLESRVCACGALPTYGPFATVPARCHACRRPEDVRLSARPKSVATKRGFRHLQVLAKAAEQPDKIIDDLHEQIMAELSKEDHSS